MIRALLSLLALSTFAIPASSADDTKPMTSMLVVARAELPDSNFKDSIVLVMNQLGPVPAGVIINRPTRIRVADLFPELERLAHLDDKLYFGGPVHIASLSFLFRAKTRRESSIEVHEGIYFSRDVDLLRELLGRDKPMEGLRIFAGFAAWARGQLESEIARGDWTLMPVTARAIFGNKAEHPWPERDLPAGARRVRGSVSFRQEIATRP
jgi:putative transcriptional regulator